MSNPFAESPPHGSRNDKAERAAAKAYAKAQRPWYKKKRFIIPGGLVALGILGSASGGGGTSSTDPVAAPESSQSSAPAAAPESAALAAPAAPAAAPPPAPAPAPANVYPGQLQDDQVVQGGGTVTIEGWQITASPLEQRDSPFGGADNVCADVVLVNTSDETEDYNGLSFSLQDPAGGIQEFGSIGEGTQLSAGSAAPGGQVSGEQCFESRSSGQYVFFYQPHAFTGEGGRVAFVGSV